MVMAAMGETEAAELAGIEVVCVFTFLSNLILVLLRIIH